MLTPIVRETRRVAQPRSGSATASLSRPRRSRRYGEGNSRYVLDPQALGEHSDRLFRAAWGMCGSRHGAEDLVQETFVNVLKHPRVLHDDNARGYLLRALRNTHSNRYRAAARRPPTSELIEAELPSPGRGEFSAREILEAIARVPAAYRDALIAVDLLGLSYREAAHFLGSREATITTRLHRGRQQVARALS